MKLIKLLTSFIIVIAIIRSSEVKDITVHRYGYRGLCANFDIVEVTKQDKVLESSFQCGRGWEGINHGIRRQLKEYEQKGKEEQESKNEENRLQSIKNDEVGHSIR